MATPGYLNALRAFEATARHGSFTAAAVELNVTPAAVGQQVRNLEAWLGVALFVRVGRGATQLELTPNAESALPEIRGAFERLAVGLSRLKENGLRKRLIITVSPAFATKWLLPRLERFQQTCPALDVRVETNAHSVDFTAERVDIGVRYGNGQWSGLTAIKLLSETLFPVCAPSYPGLLRGKLSAHAIANGTLIHDLSMAVDPKFPNWQSWLDAAGLKSVNARHGLGINNSAAVLQAVIECQGIALARSVMVQEDLQAGRLIRPEVEVGFDLSLSHAYYIVYRPESAGSSHVQAFRNWLLKEAGFSALGGDSQG